MLLAVELDVFIMSATQITGTVEFKQGYIRNYMLLRDSKSIPDKADFAAIKAKVLPEDYDFESHKELVPMQPGDVEVTYADTTPLEKDFNFKPQTSLREGLRKFAEWYKEFYKEELDKKEQKPNEKKK